MMYVNNYQLSLSYCELLSRFFISDGALSTEEAAFIRSQQDLPGTNRDDCHDANNEP